jgi:hypothetical protein
MHAFTEILKSIAEETIPKTSAFPKHITNPWFDETCKDAIKQRKKAQRVFFRRPTAENHVRFKILRARARRTINEARRRCWRQYVSSITTRTPLTKIWTMIRKIKRKSGGPSVQHLKENNN